MLRHRPGQVGAAREGAQPHDLGGGERAAVAGASGDPPAVGVQQDVGRELAGDEEAESDG